MLVQYANFYFNYMNQFMTNLWRIIDVTKIWTWPCFSLILKLWCDLFVKAWKINNCIASKVWNSFATHYIWISLQYHLLSLCNTSCQIVLHSTISFAEPLQYILSNIVAFKCEGNWKHNDHFKYLECKHLFLSPFLLNAQNNRKIKRDCKYGSKSKNPKVFIPKFCKCVMQVQWTTMNMHSNFRSM